MSESSPSGPLDPTALANLEEDVGREDLPAILATFRTETERRIGALREAVAAQDAVRAWNEAHSIKGSAAFLGATRLSETAYAMEAAGKAGDLDALRRLLPTIENEAREACEALRSFLD